MRKTKLYTFYTTIYQESICSFLLRFSLTIWSIVVIFLKAILVVFEWTCLSHIVVFCNIPHVQNDVLSHMLYWLLYIISSDFCVFFWIEINLSKNQKRSGVELLFVIGRTGFVVMLKSVFGNCCGFRFEFIQILLGVYDNDNRLCKRLDSLNRIQNRLPITNRKIYFPSLHFGMFGMMFIILRTGLYTRVTDWSLEMLVYVHKAHIMREKTTNVYQYIDYCTGHLRKNVGVILL